MILYLDTSALVKLYFEESGSEEVRNLVAEAAVISISDIGYVEARSALARREREGVFSTEEHDEVAGRLDGDFQEVYHARPLTGGIAVNAGDLARKHALRAYDAVHLATAIDLRREVVEIGNRGEDHRVTLKTYDENLLSAAHAEGLS